MAAADRRYFSFEIETMPRSEIDRVREDRPARSRGRGESSPVFDATLWRVVDDEGELVLSNLVPRLTEARRLRTGVRGRVVEDGLLALD